MLQLTGAAVESISTSFADLLRSDQATGAEDTISADGFTSSNPVENLQAWGQRLFDQLSKAGLASQKSISLMLSNTGQLTAVGDPHADQLLQQQLSQQPALLEQLRSITDHLREQLQGPSASPVPMTNGQWKLDVGSEKTHWQWSP